MLSTARLPRPPAPVAERIHSGGVSVAKAVSSATSPPSSTVVGNASAAAAPQAATVRPLSSATRTVAMGGSADGHGSGSPRPASASSSESGLTKAKATFLSRTMSHRAARKAAGSWSARGTATASLTR